MNSTAAIYARLSGMSGLATWKGQPAIFNEVAPDDFLKTPPSLPFLIVSAPTRDDPLETLTEMGRIVVQDVRGYQRFSGSAAALDGLMRAVRDRIHNKPADLAVTGGICEVSRVSGPVASPTSDEAYIGRRVTIRLDLKSN